MGLTDHNSYKGCYYCNLRGIYYSHIYYLTSPPRCQKGEVYDPANLLLKTHSEYEKRIKKIQNIQTISEYNQLVKHYGINKRSILFDLDSTSFPKTFSIDIIHLFYENIASYMLAHWMGSFFYRSKSK